MIKTTTTTTTTIATTISLSMIDIFERLKVI